MLIIQCVQEVAESPGWRHSLSTLGPSHMGSAHGDENCANTEKGSLLAKVCGEEKHATSRDEEIAAALCILRIRHFTLLPKAQMRLQKDLRRSCCKTSARTSAAAA
jgi:hypothetical protein